MCFLVSARMDAFHRRFVIWDVFPDGVFGDIFPRWFVIKICSPVVRVLRRGLQRFEVFAWCY